MNRLSILLLAFLTLPPFNITAGERLVTPEWMAREKLLGFPLQHSHLSPSELTHTYAFSIRDGKYTYSYRADNEIKEAEINGFDSTEIPLYRIQNDEGKYLTIDTTACSYDRQLAVSAVTGVNLAWRDKYDELAEDSAKNKAALQLFAIAGDESKPENAWYPKGNGYRYLPLASYKAQYDTETVLQDTVFYNKNIGRDDKSGELFRVSLYSPKDDGIQRWVAGSDSDIAPVIPMEFRWKKPTYVQMNSDSRYLVYDTNDGFYYAGGGTGLSRLKRANAHTLLAHWKIRPDEEDPYLYAFTPDLGRIYGEHPNNQLQGTYYFRRLNGGDASRVQVFDLSEYASSYTVKIDTFEITPTLYESPYYNISYYALPERLAALEAPFVDRNLTDKLSGSAGEPVGNHSYRVHLDKVESDINSATFMTIYKTTEVSLGETEHVIPYFALSLTKDDVEYFLHVNAPQDNSVYWTRLTDEERDILINPAKYGDPQYKYKYKQYKFCFPYMVDTNGFRATPVRYGEKIYEVEYQPVYFQTLSDSASTDYPYLLVGNSSKDAVAIRLDKIIMENNPEENSLKWNVYSADYSLVDTYIATSWILAGKYSDENEWASFGDGGDVEGVLTDVNFNGGGLIFIGESKASPINFGTLTDINNSQLEFIAEGQEMIGSYIKHPIFYYKIKIPDKDLYLTDSWHETDYRYKYTWFGRRYPMAYFRNGRLPDYEEYLPTRADERFIQTFGFRYIDPNYTKNPIKETEQYTFVITSNADFRNYGSDNYRYLAETRGRLVFVSGIENVLIFRFGKKDENGNFTGLEVVGRGEIFGVSGGVRLLNRSGQIADFYTIDGRLIKSEAITGVDQTVATPRGMAIVRCGGKVAKILVK
ncbi:MAG: hypothetical protein LBF08_04960 [Dysgonamonadaceae bacterium]|jgi:hypothetical protein|nr:hypothetical protein [Dysgonamonadaceae bacterium]